MDNKKPRFSRFFSELGMRFTPKSMKSNIVPIISFDGGMMDIRDRRRARDEAKNTTQPH